MTSAPYFAGRNTSSTSATTVITIGTPSGSPVAAGDTIVVPASVSSSGTISSVTDSAGNVYTQKCSSTTQNPAYVWESPGLTGGSGGGPTAALALGATVTVHWTSPTGTQVAAVVGCSGLLKIDQNPATTNAASGTAATITSGTLGGTSEACVAVNVHGNSGGAGGSWAAGWTTLMAPVLAGAGGQYMTIASQVVSSSTAVTALFTQGSSGKWCQALLTFFYQITITPSSLPGGTTGSAYSQALTAAGGTGSYTWSTVSGSLPPGLTLSSGGTISGTPTAGGTFSFTVQAADTGGNTGTQPLSITVTAAFPLAPLDLGIELNTGGWTDISPYVLQRDGTSPPVTITLGRQNETSSATAGSCQMQWNNRSGQFSPRNPTGPYYGLLGRNTPLRVSVPASGTYLRMEEDNTSYASCPDSAGLQITSGTLSVRIDLELSDWQQHTLIAKWGSTGLAWALDIDPGGQPRLGHYDGSTARSGEATVPLPGIGRIAIRADYNISAQTITFYTAPAMSGSWTQLGAVLTTAATAQAAAAGQMVQVGGTADFSGMTGAVYEARVYSTATLEAGPVFTAQTAGATSFADAQGNTWTLAGTAELSDRDYRGHFECSSLPQQWDPTGTDVWTPVQASGILRRLLQNNSPVMSAFRRGVLSYTGTLVPVAYWPMEDAQGSTQIASGLPGGLAGSFSAATPGFTGQAGPLQADSTFACSAALPSMNGAVIHLPVPPYASNGAIVIRFLLDFADTPVTGTPVIKADILAGTCSTVYLFWGTGGSLQLSGFTRTSAVVFNSTPVSFAIDNIPVWASIELTPSGGNVNWQMVFLGPGAGGYDESFSGSFAGAVGNLTEVTLNSSATLTSTVIGQVTVQSDWVSMVSLLPQLNAYSGEAAGTRFARLCAENNIACRIAGFPALTVAMGPQILDTLANLLGYCEQADRGLIYEPRMVLGLAYRTSASLLNQSPAVTLDYSAAQIGIGEGDPGLVPVDDDQYLVNDVTLSRNNGSSAQVQVTSGPLSIQPPPDGAGDYDTSLTTYNAWDADLARIASWIAWTGTVNEERYPSVPLNLARSELAALVSGIQAAGDGDMITIVNPPAWLPPGNINQLIYGTTEKLGGYWHQITWNTVPESPYEVAVAGSSNTAGVAHAQTAGAALAQAYSSTATSLLVSTTAGSQWTTTSGDFPFDIIVSGEQMTVTGIANASGSVTSGAANANVVFFSVPAGTYNLVMWQVTLSGTLGSGDANNFALYNGTTFVASSVNLAKAGTYPQTPVALTVTSGAADLKILTGGTAPTTGSVYAAAFLSPQTFTVTRSVNGVSKSQAAGAAVSLASTPVAALTGAS